MKNTYAVKIVTGYSRTNVKYCTLWKMAKTFTVYYLIVGNCLNNFTVNDVTVLFRLAQKKICQYENDDNNSVNVLPPDKGKRIWPNPPLFRYVVALYIHC
jgi:hypothetical protein